MSGGNITDVKRSDSLRIKATNKTVQQNEVRRSPSMGEIRSLKQPVRNLSGRGKTGAKDNAGADAGGKALAGKKKNTRENLRNNSQKVIREKVNIIADNAPAPVIAVNKTKEQKRAEAKQNILYYRDQLAEAENVLSEGYAGTKLTRGAYASFGSIEKKKRKDKAIEREKNADAVRDYMDNEYSELDESYILNADNLKTGINDFMKNTRSYEFDISSDEDFVRHLKDNYELTKRAAEIRKWIVDAVNGGYLPEGVDLDAVQKKITRFEELKKYLDARVEVITNPYYKYFSRDDLNYSDDQLNAFKNKFESQSVTDDFRERHKDLYKYLSAIKKLRNLSIKRKTGLSSIEERTEKKAKHEAELLKTRAEKRESIARINKYTGNKQKAAGSGPKDYESMYSKKTLRFLLDEFEHLKLSDLHFGSVKDMTEHISDNFRIFEQVRELEQMLRIAAERGTLNENDRYEVEGFHDDTIKVDRLSEAGDEWNNERLMKIHARLHSFDVMEKIITSIQSDMQTNPNDAVNKYTYDELLQRATEKLAEEDRSVSVRFGSNLEKFQSSVLKRYKERNRRKGKADRKDYQIDSIKNEYKDLRKTDVPGAENGSAVNKTGGKGKSLLKGVDVDVFITNKAYSALQLIGPVAAGFKEKKLTVREREALLERAGSELNGKHVTSRKLHGITEKYRNKLFSLKNKVSAANKTKIDDARLEDLTLLLMVPAGDEAQPGQAELEKKLEEYIKQYADKDNRYKLMDELTRDLVETDIYVFEGGMNKPIDDFFKDAPRLESISRKAYAYKNLLDANPGYKERLMNFRTLEDNEGNKIRKKDYDQVMERLDQMLVFSDYYRACKLLMTDNYYILHGNDEIGLSNTRDLTKDQRRVFDLIKMVDSYARRIKGELYAGRVNETDRDSLLTEYENENRRQAYLTGRPDLKKAKPSDVKKTHTRIGAFLRSFDMPDDVEGNVFNYRQENHPRAAAHMNGDVANYLDAYKYSRVMNMQADDARAGGYLSDKQKRLYKRLHDLVYKKGKEPVESLSFSGRDGDDESLGLNPGMARLLKDLAYNWSDTESEEELVDMLDGLTSSWGEELNKNDNTAYENARKRWLRSAKKLYDIVYSNFKQYERTYGTLQNDMSNPCFLHSLGSGQKEYIRRSRFGQDLTLLCDDPGCTYKGRKMSLGEVLVKEGLLDRKEYEESVRKCSGYYQEMTLKGQSVITAPGAVFGIENPDMAPGEILSAREEVFMTLDTAEKENVIEGPSLSHSEQRKFWKDAFKTESGLITGNEDMKTHYRKKLNMLSADEKERIRSQRRSDKDILFNTWRDMDNRVTNLYDQTISKLGNAELSEQDRTMIRKMTVFHPALYRNINEGNNEDAAAVESFITNLKGFLGIGSEDEKGEELKKQEDARREAFSFFAGKAAELSRSVEGTDVESVMSRDGVRTAANPVPDTGLYRMEASHRMYEALQDMISVRQDLNWFSGETADNFRNDYFRNLRLEVIRATIYSSFYLKLGDVTGGNVTEPGREFMNLQVLGQRLSSQGNSNLRKDVASRPEILKALKDHRIRLDEALLADIKAEEEKAPEEKKEQNNDNKINVEEEIAAQIDQNLYYQLPPIEVSDHVVAPEKGDHVSYESQGDKSYCWACVMSGLMNAYAGKKVSSLEDIRKKPIAIPTFEESGIRDRNDYDKGVSLVNNMYSGNEYGNPVIFGDYICKKLPDAAVRTAIISRENGKLPYCKRRFTETLSKKLERGPVGMLVGGHYVLIREMDGDVLKVNNSLGANPDEAVPFSQTVSQIFERAGNQVELIWLENTAGHQKEIADEFDLNYDENTGGYTFKNAGAVAANAPGQAVYDQIHNEQTILHRDGIEASMYLFDDVVFNFVYLPKGQVRQNAEQNEAGQEIAGQEIAGQEIAGQEIAGQEIEEQKIEEQKIEEQKIEEQKIEEQKVEEKKEEQKEEDPVNMYNVIIEEDEDDQEVIQKIDEAYNRIKAEREKEQKVEEQKEKEQKEEDLINMYNVIIDEEEDDQEAIQKIDEEYNRIKAEREKEQKVEEKKEEEKKEEEYLRQVVAGGTIFREEKFQRTAVAGGTIVKEYKIDKEALKNIKDDLKEQQEKWELKNEKSLNELMRRKKERRRLAKDCAKNTDQDAALDKRLREDEARKKALEKAIEGKEEASARFSSLSAEEKKAQVEKETTKYVEYVMGELVQVYDEACEACLIYAEYLKQTGECTNKAFEARMKTIEKDIKRVSRYLGGETAEEMACRESKDFLKDSRIGNAKIIIDNLAQKFEECKYQYEYRKLLNDPETKKKKDLLDKYDTVTFAEENSQSGETKELIEFMFTELERTEPDEVEEGADEYELYLIPGEKKRERLIVLFDDLLKKGIRVENFTREQFDRLEKWSPWFARRLFTDYLSRTRFERIKDTSLLLKPEDEKYILKHNKVDYPEEITIESVDKKAGNGDEEKSFKIRWTSRDNKEQKVFRMYQDPRKMNTFSGMINQRQGAKENYLLYGGTCVPSSAAQAINQLYGMPITSENQTVHLLKSFMPKSYQYERYPDRDKYGDEIVHFMGEQPINYRHSGSTAMKQLKKLLELYNIKCDEIQGKESLVDSDEDRDPETGIDSDILRFAEELKKGAVIEVTIRPEILWNRGKDPRKIPGALNKKKQDEYEQNNGLVKHNHCICLAGACYDPETDKLEGFFVKDTGSKFRFVTVQELEHAYRGIKGDGSSSSITIIHRNAFILHPPEIAEETKAKTKELEKEEVRKDSISTKIGEVEKEISGKYLSDKKMDPWLEKLKDSLNFFDHMEKDSWENLKNNIKTLQEIRLLIREKEAGLKEEQLPEDILVPLDEKAAQCEQMLTEKRDEVLKQSKAIIEELPDPEEAGKECTPEKLADFTRRWKEATTDPKYELNEWRSKKEEEFKHFNALKQKLEQFKENVPEWLQNDILGSEDGTALADRVKMVREQYERLEKIYLAPDQEHMQTVAKELQSAEDSLKEKVDIQEVSAFVQSWLKSVNDESLDHGEFLKIWEEKYKAPLEELDKQSSKIYIYDPQYASHELYDNEEVKKQYDSISDLLDNTLRLASRTIPNAYAKRVSAFVKEANSLAYQIINEKEIYSQDKFREFYGKWEGMLNQPEVSFKQWREAKQERTKLFGKYEKLMDMVARYNRSVPVPLREYALSTGNHQKVRELQRDNKLLWERIESIRNQGFDDPKWDEVSLKMEAIDAEKKKDIASKLKTAKEKADKSLNRQELDELMKSWQADLSKKGAKHKDYFEKREKYRKAYKAYEKTVTQLHDKHEIYSSKELDLVPEIAEVSRDFNELKKNTEDVFTRKILPFYAKKVEDKSREILKKHDFKALAEEYTEEKCDAFYKSWGEAMDRPDFDREEYSKKNKEFLAGFNEVYRDWNPMRNKDKTLPNLVFTQESVKKGKNYDELQAKVRAVRNRLESSYNKYCKDKLKAWDEAHKKTEEKPEEKKGENKG